MNKHPAFFKFFLVESSSTKLKIPSSFIRSLERALPQEVYLRCRCNNTWKIKVAQIENDWCFSDGWVKFVADNAIKGGDLLVFQCFCHNAFNVKLYGPNATEKNLVGKYFHETIEKEDHEQVPQEEDDDEEETESEDYEYILESEEQVSADGGDTSRNKPKRQRSSSADWYGAEIFRAGLAPQPINPYFVTTTKGKRKADLYIPKEISKDCNLDLEQELLLIDPLGREFPAKCKKWKDGRIVVTGGWRRLCRRNLVDEQDKCICEFIQGRDDGRLVLNVSFVRGNGHLG